MNATTIDREALAASILDKAHNYARERCPRPDELTEAAIDAATSAITRTLDRIEDVREFEDYAWKAVVKAVTRAIHRYKKRRRLEAQPIESEGGRNDPADNRSPLLGELPFEIRECLPPKVRETAELVAVHGYTAAEAARLLGVDRKTIWRRLQVASARVRGEINTKQPHSNAHHSKRKGF